MLWVTRDHVHVDRVACPWLISRFIDPNAQFVFLPKEEIKEFVEKTGAIAFDSKTGIGFDHHKCNGEDHCTFDALIEEYHLERDPALQRMREIVRAADTGRLHEVPLALALEAIATGSVLLVDTDHDALEHEFPFYDTLYTYFQREIIIEKYKEEYEQLKTRAERNDFLLDKILYEWNVGEFAPFRDDEEETGEDES